MTSGGTTSHTRYVYDGNQIVMQVKGGGQASLAANIAHRYLRGPAVDQLLADEQLMPVTGGGYDFDFARHNVSGRSLTTRARYVTWRPTTHRPA